MATMEWIVNIENEPKSRILICYDVMVNKLNFHGQHRIKNIWTNFNILVSESNIDSEKIEEYLYATYYDMSKKISTLNNIDTMFYDIKLIEIKD